MKESSIQKETGKRLNELRKKLGLKRDEMANLLGLNPATLNNYLSGTREIPVDLLVKLKEKFNVNLNWLLTGEGNVFNDELIIQETETDSIVKIPYYKNNFVSAGFGLDNQSEKEVALVSFSTELLKIMAGTQINRGLFLVRVFGNSMEPTIPEKSIAIVLDYRVEGFLRESSIYVIKHNGEEFIKRVFKDPINKKLKLVSDNPIYPPIEVSGEESDRFSILGRVIGYIASA